MPNYTEEQRQQWAVNRQKRAVSGVPEGVVPIPRLQREQHHPQCHAAPGGQSGLLLRALGNVRTERKERRSMRAVGRRYAVAMP